MDTEVISSAARSKLGLAWRVSSSCSLSSPPFPSFFLHFPLPSLFLFPSPLPLPFSPFFVRDRLHWLPVLQRIEYKVCALIYKCLHRAAPTYLTELCLPVSESVNRGHLRSAVRGNLVVPRSRTTRYGQRSFAVAGATLWNSLPLSVRDPSLTLSQFCARLKTALFCRAYETLA